MGNKFESRNALEGVEVLEHHGAFEVGDQIVVPVRWLHKLAVASVGPDGLNPEAIAARQVALADELALLDLLWSAR